MCESLQAEQRHGWGFEHSTAPPANAGPRHPAPTRPPPAKALTAPCGSIRRCNPCSAAVPGHSEQHEGGCLQCRALAAVCHSMGSTNRPQPSCSQDSTAPHSAAGLLPGLSGATGKGTGSARTSSSFARTWEARTARGCASASTEQMPGVCAMQGAIRATCAGMLRLRQGTCRRQGARRASAVGYQIPDRPAAGRACAWGLRGDHAATYHASAPREHGAPARRAPATAAPDDDDDVSVLPAFFRMKD